MHWREWGRWGIIRRNTELTPGGHAMTRAAHPWRPAMEQAETTIRIDGPHASPPDAQGWHVRAGLHFREVELLLDSLEAAGVAEREVQVTTDGTFQVLWRA